MRAIAAQRGDVVVLIEATRRWDRFAHESLPERRAMGVTRADGMPIAVHASDSLEVQFEGDGTDGWLECNVGSLHLLPVHMVAPYLPWRLGRRERQLGALAERVQDIAEDDYALTIGDFNTASFERVWRRFQKSASPWRRVDHLDGERRGTWPFGHVWSPVAVDHALCPPDLASRVDAWDTGVRTFPIPGSDHLGLSIELPDAASC